MQIMNPFDHKRLSWKVTDGIRETTWPGVYNRSSLDGRTDYIVLPDWDCYSVSGKQLDFSLPAGTNYMEICGGAWGKFTDVGDKPKGCEKAFYVIEAINSEREVSFINEMKEQPLNDISAFCITGLAQIPQIAHSFDTWEHSDEFLRTRYPIEEIEMPIAHMCFKFDGMENVGLDGILFDLPSLDLAPTHGEYILLQFAIKDPIWRYRNMLEITLAVKPGEAKHLYFDLRDRILRKRGLMHISIACSSSDFSGNTLKGAKIHFVTKPFAEAKHEHVEDRFMQVRDHFSNMVEERPKTNEFNAFNRFYEDITDLLRVAPEHKRGREYYYLHLGGERPPVELPSCPKDVPQWAFWQTEYLKHFKHVVNWWIDNRQIENGEFGGGLSDDGDLTAIWPSLYLLGCEPDKIKHSLELQMDAFYEQDMFSSGVCKIQTDQLHTLEDGVQVIGQCLTVAPSDPEHLERAMETSRAMWRLTGINRAGHRHFYSAYYSGHKIALERPWNFQNSDTLNILHPSYMLLRYNGNPYLTGLIVELADSLLAHTRDGKVYSQIIFDTDEDEYVDTGGTGHACQEDFLFKTAYEMTGDKKYLAVCNERIHWQAEAESDDNLAGYYKQAVEDMLLLEYINTDGQLWSDRVQLTYDKIQQDRLGGIGHIRFDFYPRHFIEWRFEEPGADEKVAVQVTSADSRHVKLRVCNLASRAISAEIIGAGVLPGTWSLADSSAGEREISFGREESFGVSLPPQMEIWLELKLKSDGQPYNTRPDLGIGRKDIRMTGEGLEVTVHSLGAVGAGSVPVVLMSADGKELARSYTEPMPEPKWLFAVTCNVLLNYKGEIKGCFVEVDPEGTLCEISKKNNKVYI